MGRPLSLAACCWIALAAAGTAQGPPPAEDRLAALERRLQQLQDTVEQLNQRLARAEGKLGELQRGDGLLVPLSSRPETLAAIASFQLLAPSSAPLEAGWGKGPAEVDHAAALRFLKSAQGPDGRWASPGGKHDVATTALALLAFCASGNTHRAGPFKRTVNSGLNWLKRCQVYGSGLLRSEGPFPTLDHALGLQALAESLAVTRDFRLRKPIEAAHAALLELQAESGGWSLGHPSLPANSLATAHALLALRACRAAGVSVDARVLSRAGAFLASLTGDDGLVGFERKGDGVSLAPRGQQAAPLPLFSACGALGRVFAGERVGSGSLTQTIKRLVLPAASHPDPGYAYLATFAVFQQGGRRMEKWVEPLRRSLNTFHEPTPEGGASWSPSGFWGKLGGATGTTALNVLALELCARYERAREDR